MPTAAHRPALPGQADLLHCAASPLLEDLVRLAHHLHTFLLWQRRAALRQAIEPTNRIYQGIGARIGPAGLDRVGYIRARSDLLGDAIRTRAKVFIEKGIARNLGSFFLWFLSRVSF